MISAIVGAAEQTGASTISSKTNRGIVFRNFHGIAVSRLCARMDGMSPNFYEDVHKKYISRSSSLLAKFAALSSFLRRFASFSGSCEKTPVRPNAVTRLSG